MNKIKTALISVSDKRNLKTILSSLKKNNIKIISSGGTYKEIKKLKFKCSEVSAASMTKGWEERRATGPAAGAN